MKQFSREEIERMREEMTTQFAPATTFEEAGLEPRRPSRRIRDEDIVHVDEPSDV